MIARQPQRSLAGALFCVLASGCLSFAGKTEDISFSGSGGEKLQGTLVIPNDAVARFPVVVLLHGAEPATRDRMIYKLTGNVFVERGMAVFVYDKRGAGQSEGDHNAATYAQLVDDAVAAVTMLQGRDDIDATRIGLMGVSESGWLTPEIAERTGGLAFVLNKVGAALSVRDTIAWEIYNELLADGVSESAAREQVEIYRRIWAYRIQPTASVRQSLEKTLAQWSEREESHLPTALKKVSASYIADISYDPTPYLRRHNTPMLYLYGSEDVNIPTEECVVRLKELAASGRPVSFHVYQNAGHELGGFSPFPPFYQFVEGYAERLGDFAERHMKLN